MKLKLVGSSLIIAGTALGAGMLAIPMVLAQFGLLWSTLLMVFIWLGTTYAALLLLEASVKVGRGVSMSNVARDTLGIGGQLITNVLLYSLLVCLMMAYIIGAGDLMQNISTSFGINLTKTTAQISFTFITGMIVSCGTAVIDKFNRLLFAAMLLALLITLAHLAPNLSLGSLTQVVTHDNLALVKTSSVLFTSFCFLVVIPSLATYNKEATKSELRNMLLLGSVIPLVCYLLWLYAAVGNLPSEQLTHFANVSELISALSAQYEHLELILSIFTALALLTSFLGVALALFDQNTDVMKSTKAITFMMTFILPLTGAILAPEQFLNTLSHAGIILVFLAVFIPMAMVSRVRKQSFDIQTYQASGGIPAMITLLVFGSLMLIVQCL
ncbi:amino acid permease [Shewanella surugensis]|uniref:Tyrosine transporter n=1 Tax=Shewanella surugensis TaxID=212020 RepID=A0ABT0LES7_9GAMM|nr:aromatic amino acid transport family protein [Shewanella surugensis]MCL1126203.1 tyrosine transporter [Shewanella surugensis]